MGRNSRFEGLTNRSPLLAQILQQMQQHSVYQPQSYGALAAGLGTAFLQKKTLEKEIQKQHEQQQGMNSALAKAMSQAQGGMQTLPGTGVQLGDVSHPMGGSPANPQGALQTLLQAGHPMGEQLAGQQMMQAFAPPPEPTPMDLGDRIALRQGNRIIGEFTKAPTPDTALREGGENNRTLFREGREDERFNVSQKGINQRFYAGEAGENARAQLGADNRQLKSTQALRKEYEQLLPVQQLQKVLPQVQGMAKAPDTAAGDLAVINGAAKIMDPDTGIREQDVNNVLRSTTPGQVVLGNLRFFVNGEGRLTPQSRKDLMDSVGAKVSGFEDAAKRSRSQYEQYAKQQGVDPFDVVGAPFDNPFTSQAKEGWSIEPVK